MKDIDAYKARLLAEISRHIGEERAIGMDRLYDVVFDGPVNHKINDTRKLRKVVTDLRYEGVPICSVSSKDGGGYYLAAAGSEFRDYRDRQKRRALKILARVAKMERISLPELLGQMKLNLEANA